MKISPSASLGNLQSVDGQSARVDSLRAIKMNVNQTPGLEATKPDEEMSIPPTNEDKKEPVTEATEPISPHFAALARERRALQRERRAFEEQKKALEASGKNPDVIQKAKLLEKPIRTLLDLGVSYEKMTEEIIGSQNNPELAEIKAKLAAVEEGVEKRFTDQQEQQIKIGLASKSREIDGLLNDDAYELVRTTGTKRKVLELIERTFRETGEELDSKEGLRLYEDYLFKNNQKLVNTKKLQSLFEKPAEQPRTVQQRPQGMRTLTNKDTASVPMSAKARAFAAFYGTLKK